MESIELQGLAASSETGREFRVSRYTLVGDAGHTRVKLALCRNEEGGQLPTPVDSVAAVYDVPLDWEKVDQWTQEHSITSVVITGTNESRARALVDSWPASLPTPFFLKDKTLIPITIDVMFPQKVGMDRLLNGVAANVIREAGQPAIVVDSGTAITVDLVSADGSFRGGSILPGILLGAKSLHEETTTLPHVNVWELLKKEPAPLGRCTEDAIAAGLYWGHLGAVKEMISRYRDLLPASDPEPLVLLTGGASVILAPYIPGSRREPDLSLQGLAVVANQLDTRSGTH